MYIGGSSTIKQLTQSSVAISLLKELACLRRTALYELPLVRTTNHGVKP
jgi:hypothetical protein